MHMPIMGCRACIGGRACPHNRRCPMTTIAVDHQSVSFRSEAAGVKIFFPCPWYRCQGWLRPNNGILFLVAAKASTGEGQPRQGQTQKKIVPLDGAPGQQKPN